MPNVNPWIARVWSEFRAGTLTRTYRDVLLTLQTFRGNGGLICPAHATLADRAKCGVRTVQRALRQAERLGLVLWVERRIRRGWRWLRTSNVYHLSVPDAAVDSSLRPLWPCHSTNCQPGRGGESLEKEDANQGRKAALAAMIREAAGLPDLLAIRRAVMEGRLQARV